MNIVTDWRRQRFPENYLDRVYPMPQPLLRLEEHQRKHHLDLAGFEDEELLADSERAAHRAALERDPGKRRWLRARVRAGEQERRRRVTDATVRLRGLGKES